MPDVDRIIKTKTRFSHEATKRTKKSLNPELYILNFFVSSPAPLELFISNGVNLCAGLVLRSLF